MDSSSDHKIHNRLFAIIDAIQHTAECFFFIGASSWETKNQQALILLAKAVNASCISIHKIPPDLEKNGVSDLVITWKDPNFQNEDFLIESPDWDDFQSRWQEGLQSQIPVCSTDWAADEPSLEIFSSYKTQSLLILPVFLHGEWWGTISIEQTSPQKPWDEYEIAALTASSLIISLAIQHQMNAVKLHDSEQNYRSIVEHQTEIVSRFDSNLILNFVNDFCCQYFGLDREDMLGKSFLPLIPEQDQKTLMVNLAKLTPFNPIHTSEHFNINADGEIRFLHWTNQAFFDQNDQVVEYLSVGRDITERKQLENALRKSEERFRAVSRIISDYAYSFQVNDQGEITFEWLNDPPKKMFEKTSARKKESNQWIRFIHPEDIPLAEKHLEKVLAGQFDTVELRYARPNGETGWLRNHSWPEIPDKSIGDRPTIVFGAGNDITESKLAVLKLLDSEREKALILDSLAEIVDYLDRDYTILWANNMAAESLGGSKEDLVGKHCYSLWHKRDTPCENCPIQKCFKTGKFHEGQIQSPDGRVWHISGNPVINTEGEIIGVVETSLDITERTIAEERLWRRVAIEELITSLSTQFINLTAGQVNREINKALHTLAKFVGSNHSFITLLSSDGKTIEKQYDWIAENIQSKKEISNAAFSIETFNWSISKLKRHENLFLPRTAELPDEAQSEREHWLSQNIQSILAIPLVLNEMLIGFWGFISHNEEKLWQEDDLLILKLMGDVLINVIVRKEAEEALRRERDFAEGLIETAQVIVLVLDPQGQILRFNPYFELLSGYQLAEAKGKNWFETFIPEYEREDLQTFFFNSIRLGKISTCINPILNRTQQLLEIEWHNRVLKNASGEIIGVLSTGQDITKRLRSEQELKETNEALNTSNKQLKKLHHEATLLNQMADLFQNCQEIDEVYQVVFQFTEQLFPGLTGALYIKNEETNSFQTVITWGSDFQGEQEFFANDCWALRRNDVYRVDLPQMTLRCPHMNEDHFKTQKPYLCAPLNAQENTIGMLHFQGNTDMPYERIEQLALTMAKHLAMTISNLRLQNKLKMQSIRDPLTGLFNRRYMDETLERELLRAVRQNHPTCLLMLDLDRFKHYNDTHGHEAGDLLLQKLGEYLKLHIRSSDVACRYGGEEFIVILPETNLEEASHRAEELRSGIKELVIHHRGQLLSAVTVSIGISAFPNHGKSSETLLRAVDTALYRAKAAGRNQVIVAAD